MTETTAGAFTVPLYSKTAEFQNMYITANQHKAYLIEKSHFIWESELAPRSNCTLHIKKTVNSILVPGMQMDGSTPLSCGHRSEGLWLYQAQRCADSCNKNKPVLSPSCYTTQRRACVLINKKYTSLRFSSSGFVSRAHLATHRGTKTKVLGPPA